MKDLFEHHRERKANRQLNIYLLLTIPLFLVFSPFIIIYQIFKLFKSEKMIHKTATTVVFLLMSVFLFGQASQDTIKQDSIQQDTTGQQISIDELKSIQRQTGERVDLYRAWIRFSDRLVELRQMYKEEIDDEKKKQIETEYNSVQKRADRLDELIELMKQEEVLTSIIQQAQQRQENEKE